MIRSLPAFFVLAITVFLPLSVEAQYFGRNKVQYDRFDFRMLETEHFNLHFYPEAQVPIEDVARMSERWYERLARIFEHELDRRRPLIFYADHPDFQQTNVLRGMIGEGTGGVTEGLRDRVIMPLGSSYADTDHVLGHELVHSFQFDIARTRGGGGIGGLMQLPLWFVEGMAEYYSLGPSSTLTGIWLRDALLRDEFPTLRQLTREQQRYFPYRFGHAFFAWVGGEYGDEVIPSMLRVGVETGYESAVRQVLGVSGEELSAAWQRSVSEHYAPRMEGRTSPAEAGSLLLSPATGAGRQNVAPSLSPDGRYLAFLSERDLFTVELFLADARTGEILRSLTRSTRDGHFDAIRFIDSSGGWSPDGERIAVSVFYRGRNQIQVYRAADGRIVQRIDVDSDIGEVRGPVFSPDGERIAFSGQAGGLTNLFEVDVATGEVTQLTADRHAALHPVYSPDGRTLAFVTDRGPGTDFNRLTFGPRNIALLDRETRQLRELQLFQGAQHWNPQFAPDGNSLYFLADPDGFRDIYRVGLDDGEIVRLTDVVTGVTGITDATPALSVSREAGTAAFSVFDRGEFHIYGLDAAELTADVVDPTDHVVAEGRRLPGGATSPDARVNRLLADADVGLPPEGRYRTEGAPATDRSLGLDYIGQASIGVGRDQFGTMLGGSISMIFSDLLGDRTLFTAISAQGEIQDLGGEIFYVDQERRWNWGAGFSHVPTRFFRRGIVGEDDGGFSVLQDEERIRATELVGLYQFPISSIRRVDVTAGLNRYDFSARRERLRFDQFGNFVDRDRTDLAAPDPLNLMRGSVAWVEDNSFFGFNAPVRGWRARYEVGYTAGTVDFAELTLDHRRYFAGPMPEMTLAVRGLHIGRYGSDVESSGGVFRPLFLGAQPLIRGYANDSFRTEECTFTDDGRCAEFDRLLGHRLGVFNVEWRTALLGTDRFGLLNFSLLPTDLVLFFDAGAAWSGGESADFRWDRETVDRVPVASTGVSLRANLLGALVVETYWAYPFHRPERGFHFGLNLSPGW